MPIAQIKSTFPYLSAVPVFLSEGHKYWWLLKYPPKWHLGYDTSCITRLTGYPRLCEFLMK